MHMISGQGKSQHSKYSMYIVVISMSWIFSDCPKSSDHLYFVWALFLSFLGRKLCLLFPLLSILLAVLSDRSSTCLFVWLLRVIGFFISTPFIGSPALFLFFGLDCGHFLKTTSKQVSEVVQALLTAWEIE